MPFGRYTYVATMQLSEHYGKEFGKNRNEWEVLGLGLQGWSCKAEAGPGTLGVGSGDAGL